jgi:hypothetical protein
LLSSGYSLFDADHFASESRPCTYTPWNTLALPLGTPADLWSAREQSWRAFESI